jgi:copper chaperone CopZ
MAKTTFDVPAMYGDHHVNEVRRILIALPGVEKVYASSAFQVVEVIYDPVKTNELELQVKLDNAGYLGEWSVRAESSVSAAGPGGEKFFRHTTVYEQTKSVVGFAQRVSYQGRPLWPCPGMGPIGDMDEENK